MTSCEGLSILPSTYPPGSSQAPPSLPGAVKHWRRGETRRIRAAFGHQKDWHAILPVRARRTRFDSVAMTEFRARLNRPGPLFDHSPISYLIFARPPWLCSPSSYIILCCVGRRRCIKRSRGTRRKFPSCVPSATPPLILLPPRRTLHEILQETLLLLSPPTRIRTNHRTSPISSLPSLPNRLIIHHGSRRVLCMSFRSCPTLPACQMLTSTDQRRLSVHRRLSDGHRQRHRGRLQDHHRRCPVGLPRHHHLPHLRLLRTQQKNNTEVKNMTSSGDRPYEL